MAKADQGNQGGRKPPAYECRMGRIRAVVWKNDGKDGAWYSVSVTRSYKDGEQNWKQATSFGRDDLLVVAEAVRTCWLWIMAQTTTQQDGGIPVAPGDDHE